MPYTTIYKNGNGKWHKKDCVYMEWTANTEQMRINGENQPELEKMCRLCFSELFDKTTQDKARVIRRIREKLQAVTHHTKALMEAEKEVRRYIPELEKYKDDPSIKLTLQNLKLLGY